MAGYIPDDIVERIKAEADIVSVISAFINLKKSGKDYKGLCPFHQEKTASFYVIPSKGFYHCFGCGAGGNAVNFIMAHERLEYPDALRYLAAKAGITIPETSSRRSDTEAIYEALSLAGSYFARMLRDESIGATAMEYLRSRDISEATIGEFGMGYAPSGWDGLIKYALKNGVSPTVLEKAGLVSKKENYFDRFRNRLMVPIRALSGRTVGFGGRIMPGSDEGAKYINSPETEIYKKGNILFGLDLTKDELRRKNEAIIVEGYFDLISLYQNGIRNVVAVSGTGFTIEQASLLARFCENVILLYDSDSAGIKAAYRACGMLYNSAVKPQVALLPKGFDPDKFVREKRASDLRDVTSKSFDIIDLVYARISGNFAAQALSVQGRIINALTEIIRPIENRTTRKLLLDKMSDRLDLDIRTIKQIGEEHKIVKPEDKQGKFEGRIKPEKEFISLLLANQELINDCGEISNSLYVDESNARIFEIIRDQHEKGIGFSIADLFDKVDSDEQRRLLSEIAVIDNDVTDVRKLFEDHLDRFKLIARGRRKEELKGLISEAEKRFDQSKVDELTREFQNLQTRGGNG